jgi:hypothetical protein
MVAEMSTNQLLGHVGAVAANYATNIISIDMMSIRCIDSWCYYHFTASTIDLDSRGLDVTIITYPMMPRPLRYSYLDDCTPSPCQQSSSKILYMHEC